MNALNFKALKHQAEFINSTENTILVGGFGSGKSKVGVAKTIIKKLMNPTKNVGYFLPTYKLVKKIAHDYFLEELNGFNLQDYGIVWSLNKNDNEINFWDIRRTPTARKNNKPDYGAISFNNMSKPETIVGFEMSYILIDEADVIEEEIMNKVWNKVLGRKRTTKKQLEDGTFVSNTGDKINIDMVSTPEGFGFLYKKTKTGLFNVIRAKTTDNPFLDDNYIPDMKATYPPELVNAYINGDFVNLATNTVYFAFKRRLNISTPDIPKYEKVYIGQDFNVGGCISIVTAYRNNVVYVIDEIISDNTNDVCVKLNKYKHRAVIFPDASGDHRSSNSNASDIQILRYSDYVVAGDKRNPPIADRVNAVNNLFAKRRLKISSSCVKTIEAVEQQAYDRFGKPIKSTDPASHDDFVDALGYVIYHNFRDIVYERSNSMLYDRNHRGRGRGVSISVS